MAKQERKENKTKNKKESKLVNKESFCATIALFSILLLLILCTRTVIFGSFGFTMHAFMTGAFGYFAYPLTLGLLYLSAFGLFGKRLVKNRKLFLCIALSIVFVSLVVHTVLTYSWFEKENYIAACFKAGENFPKTTVCGVVGGLLVYAVASLTTKVGALIVYGIIAAFFLYICITLVKTSAKQKSKPAEKTEVSSENAEIPLYQQPTQQGERPQTLVSEQIPLTQDENSERIPMPGYHSPDQEQLSSQENVQDEIAGGYMPTVAQRPGFTLREDENKTFNNNRSFSPFGMPDAQESASEPIDPSYMNSREFLFGGTPAENYKRNLIFDPTAKVNNRPNVSPNPPTIQDGYMPSYMNAYQSSVNENVQPARPVKIVDDRSQNDYNNRFGGYNEQTTTPSSMEQAPWQSENTFAQDPTPTVPLSNETDRRDVYEDFGSSEWRSVEENDRMNNTQEVDEPRVQELDRGRDDGYRRHDYMDLFSTDNPNVFGGEEETLLDRAVEEGRVDRDISDRSFDRGNAFSDESRNSRFSSYDETPRDRDGLNLLDDDNPYELRSDYEVSRGEDRGFDAGFDETTPLRGRGYDEDITEDSRTANTSSPLRSPMDELTEITPPEPAPAVMPKVTEIVPTAPPKPRVIRPYVRVPLDDFDCRDVQPTSNDEEVEETKQNIITTLSEFRVNGAEIASVTFGPTVTRYNVAIPRSISPKKVVALDQSIAISLHSSGVNVYPNYEDGVVSIEVPNKERQFVQLGCMLSGDTFVNAKSSSLMFAMGKDVANRKVYGDISKMIHLLVAGSSGSGKSVFLGALIISLIYKYSPEELRLILIDPKMTEFVIYNGLPHLMINEIITDANKAVQSLNWAIGEMNRRYQLFEKMSRSGTYVQNLDQYNAQLQKAERLPKIVIIIDELADLMLAAKKEMEDRIQNLTQKARAAGIHLIVATQRPSTDVITGVIKSNLPTRVAFYVATDVDSRVILDQTGAQKLLGKGDFLYTMPGLAAPIRVQSAFISPEESQRVVNFIKNNNEAYFDEEATAFINSRGGYAGDPSDPLVGDKGGAVDPIYIEALKYVILSGSASISMIQRKCSTGYSRAGKIIEWMEDMGYISPFDGAKARKVLITKEEFESKYGPL